MSTQTRLTGDVDTPQTNFVTGEKIKVIFGTGEWFGPRTGLP